MNEEILKLRRQRFLTNKSYESMLARCRNSSHPRYRDYGGRGISVCKRWRKSFQNFVDDMGLKPDGLSLDRINNDGNYTPQNCRWATRQEQIRNRRDSFLITVKGKTMTAMAWSEALGVNPQTIKHRILRGYPPALALSDEDFTNRPPLKNIKKERNGKR